MHPCRYFYKFSADHTALYAVVKIYLVQHTLLNVRSYTVEESETCVATSTFDHHLCASTMIITCTGTCRAED